MTEPAVLCAVRPGAYADSVVLMQLQRGLAALPGVIDAGVVMATEANREILEASGLLRADLQARADDLLIAVKAETNEAAEAALASFDALSAERASSGSAGYRPHSLATALEIAPEAGWVLVSVPGEYAGDVAEEAIEGGRNVFLYSDNVGLADELRLKNLASDRRRLVMGPDCGTAVVNGVGLGFANRVRRGSIGLIAASGTGLQTVASEVHGLGAGLSHALGTGGRDLTADIGGITAFSALGLLMADSDTEVIVVVSKPPAPNVAARFLSAALHSNKPVVVDLLGYAPPARKVGSLWFATGLGEAAEIAVSLANDSIEPSSSPDRPPWGPKQAYLRGLFSGGTLAYEAVLRLRPFLTPLTTNTPVGDEAPLRDPHRSEGHAVVDLGADEFTMGRPHPMIDPEARVERIEAEADDPEVAVILLDVVLGDGADKDPASSLAPTISGAKETAAAAGRHLEVVTVVVGTDEDPQGLQDQMDALQGAGATVYQSLGGACEATAMMLCATETVTAEGESRDPLTSPLAAINVGLEIFHDSLADQEVPVVHVNWRPPAGGDPRLAKILEQMKG